MKRINPEPAIVIHRAGKKYGFTLRAIPVYMGDDGRLHRAPYGLGESQSHPHNALLYMWRHRARPTTPASGKGT
ncbi:hypothetical protein CRUP_001547 [Coryphaenoides rupestris]|nr:hypothetical protein CRUP_001547 [Coryphaenoides rupestris]